MRRVKLPDFKIYMYYPYEDIKSIKDVLTIINGSIYKYDYVTDPYYQEKWMKIDDSEALAKYQEFLKNPNTKPIKLNYNHKKILKILYDFGYRNILKNAPEIIYYSDRTLDQETKKWLKLFRDNRYVSFDQNKNQKRISLSNQLLSKATKIDKRNISRYLKLLRDIHIIKRYKFTHQQYHHISYNELHKIFSKFLLTCDRKNQFAGV